MSAVTAMTAAVNRMTNWHQHSNGTTAANQQTPLPPPQPQYVVQPVPFFAHPNLDVYRQMPPPYNSSNLSSQGQVNPSQPYNSQPTNCHRDVNLQEPIRAQPFEAPSYRAPVGPGRGMAHVATVPTYPYAL